MKKFFTMFLLLLLAILSGCFSAQKQDSDKVLITRYGINAELFSCASKHHDVKEEIYGLDFSAFSRNFEHTTNGIRLNLIDTLYSLDMAEINGARLGIIGFEQEMHGIDIQLLVRFDTGGSHGITIAPINLSMPNQYSAGTQIGLLNSSLGEFRGAEIGIINFSGNLRGVQFGIINATEKSVRGIQIGILNGCQNINGLQIGLLNYNSSTDLWLPFVNWSFGENPVAGTESAGTENARKIPIFPSEKLAIEVAEWEAAGDDDSEAKINLAEYLAKDLRVPENKRRARELLERLRFAGTLARCSFWRCGRSKSNRRFGRTRNFCLNRRNSVTFPRWLNVRSFNR